MICQLCQNNSFAPWTQTGTYSVVRCTQCGLGMTSPPPRPEVSHDVNQEKYQLAKCIRTYQSRPVYFSSRYRKQLKRIQAFRPSGKLLDIGCNIGTFLVEARNMGFNVAGVEMNPDCAEYARDHHGLDVFTGRLDEANLPASSVDVITLFDVLEHVPNPQALLADIYRILKPHGILMLQSPNLESQMAVWFQSEWQWLCLPDHIYHFTPSTMLSMISQSGFAMTKMRTWTPADVFWDNWLQADLRSKFLPRLIRKILSITKSGLLVSSLLQSIQSKQLRVN